MKSYEVCLINPPTTDPSELRSYFPTPLLYLGGVLKKYNISTQLWDFDLFFKLHGNISENDFRKLLRHGVSGSGAKVFGISSICSNFPMAIWIAKEIKEYLPEALIILGGPQPSSVPKETIEAFKFIDVVVAGEGEITLEEMIKCKFDLEKIKKIEGVYSRDDSGNITEVPKRKLVDDMDTLPLPDYSLINFRDYVDHLENFGQKFLMGLEVGRGCPFRCTFCSTSIMWERKFRVKSPLKIYQEMKALNSAYGFDSFEFIHDNFTTSRKFVNDFCETMELHNKEKFKWYAASRTDCISIPLMERMHGAGLRWLFFGIETGSDRMQKVIKKNLDFAHFDPILMRGNELGIGSVAAFILGFPEEEKEDMDATVWRAVKYKAAGTRNVYIGKLSPLTGTEIYNQYKDDLTEISYVSSLSPQNFSVPYVVEIIKKYPKIFSSFYHVPHKHFSMEYITKMEEFSHLLINGDPHLTLEVMERKKLGATDLFLLFEPWAKMNKIPYYNYRVFSERKFKDIFRSFVYERLKTTQLQKGKDATKKIPSQMNVPIELHSSL